MLTLTNTNHQPVTMRVEVARTDDELEHGLMLRTSLPENEGMLFDYGEEVDHTEYWFWMKNTLIPLSIAFIAEGGRIVSIHDMQPLDETHVHAAAPYRYALEANQGFFEARNIKAGCEVSV